MMKRKSGAKSRSRTDRYRSVFDHSAVSLWEEDISELRAMIQGWRDRGITDLRSYLRGHPNVLRKAIRAIKVVDVNETTLQLYETDDKSKLLGSLGMVLTEEMIPGAMQYVIAIAEGRKKFETDTVATSFKGKRLDLFVTIFIPGESDDYPYALVSIFDISERKRLERNLEGEKSLLRAVIDAIPDIIFLKDRQSRFILANQATADLMGAGSPAELIGRTDHDFYPRNLAEEFLSDEKQLMETGQPLIDKEEQKQVGGEKRWIAMIKLPVRDADGKVAGLVGTGRDFTERRRFEVALRESEEKYRTIFMEAPIGIFHSTPEGRLISVNPAFARMMGYDSSEQMIEMVTKGPSGELYEETLDRSTNLDGPFPENGWQKGEIRYRHKNGGVVVARSTVRSYVPLGSAGPEIEGFVEDITGQKQAEQDLAWERHLFTILMESSPEHIYFKDRESRFIRISRSHARALGLDDPSEAAGKSDADFFDAEHAQKALQDERQVMKTGTALMDIEELLVPSDRPATWVITSKMPFLDQENTIVGTFGISHDITKRKMLEAKNQQLATLVDAADDAIVGIDLSRRITVWNRGAEQVYGYRASEMIGAVTSTLIPPELEEEARIFRERLMKGEQISHFETTRLRKDGSRIIVSLTLSAIHDEKARVVGFASVARDITEQKAVQAQLNRAQRLESLATLAGGVAHQFNNINTVIRGYLELILAQAGLPPRIVAFVEAASTGVTRAGDITNRLLALAESGNEPSDAVQLSALARDTLSAHADRIENEDIKLILEILETPPIWGDASRLKFALSSIVDNALDSLLDRPVRTVIVRTGATTDAVFFEIEDSGCGIPEKDLPRIFSPFFTRKGEWAPPGSPQARLKGVGLSLAISNTMVTEYGGRIDVRSTKDAGSVFKVIVPRAV
jgi:PAS domain S-box-containing protein